MKPKHRIGSYPGEPAGIYSAQRGTYRVRYRASDEHLEVVVLRVDHRGEAYRPL